MIYRAVLGADKFPTQYQLVRRAPIFKVYNYSGRGGCGRALKTFRTGCWHKKRMVRGYCRQLARQLHARPALSAYNLYGNLHCPE